MGGALLNLVAYGNLNVIINGNPSKTFFKSTYAKYTNFGLQKFRLNFNGLRTLNLDTQSTFTFKVERYGDLFLDHYLVIKLPHIWSPILTLSGDGGGIVYSPYEFKWIKNLGCQLIKNVTYRMGSQVIQKFTGQYLHNMVQRDFSKDKKNLFDEMIGNVSELNDPANYSNRNGNYPNAWYYDADISGIAEPSIRARTLYIPLNIWSTLSSKMAIPLTSLQYTDFEIEIELRKIKDLYVIRNVFDPNITGGSFLTSKIPPYQAPYISPTNLDGNALGTTVYAFYRFTHAPPKEVLKGDTNDGYNSAEKVPDLKIHMIATYAMLSEEERTVFAIQPQKYLVKEIYEERYKNITQTHRTELRNSLGLVSSWMWFFQRTDVHLRNEWSNYTNWPYDYIPQALTDLSNVDLSEDLYPKLWCPYPPCICDGLSCRQSIKITGPFHQDNEKYIMTKWGLLLDGTQREDDFEAGVYNLIEKYIRTAGNSELGLYCYNFSLNTDPFNFQPNGAINLSKFSRIEFEYATILPPLDPRAKTYVICDKDPVTGASMPIGVNKPTWNIFLYNYDLYVMEERYNILTIESGLGALMFAR